MIMAIWGVDTLNKIFIKVCYAQIKFPKNQVVSGKTVFFVIGPFYIPHAICLSIGF